MSDITKKIFSIEPVDAVKDVEPKSPDIIKPVSRPSLRLTAVAPKEDIATEKVPDFVTREEIKPLTRSPAPVWEEAETRSKGWVFWSIIGFSILYIAAIGLFFGMPLLNIAPNLLTITGLVLLLILPIVLLIVLGTALRNLGRLSQQTLRYAQAAEILVTPETEALGRATTLAGAIQTEISKFNQQLETTVGALKKVETSVSLESQALDAAGLQLSSRSEDVGRNLTLQRQALESISGTFDARMGTLSAQITETSKELENVCVEAETRLSKAGGSLMETTAQTETHITASTKQITEEIAALGEVNSKIETTSETMSSDLVKSAEKLQKLQTKLDERAEALEMLSTGTVSQITNLQTTLDHGNQMLSDFQSAADLRESEMTHLYDRLSLQLKKSEDDTLASQGQTARVVEANLSQMRRDFGQMETDLKTLQVKLNNLREHADELPAPEVKPSRLNLTPLSSDFPPVEPPRQAVKREPLGLRHTPFDLDADMELEIPADEIADIIPEVNPDVISRPGQPVSSKKGFGRRNDKESSGWKWRDMLGGLEKPGSVPGAANLTSPQTADSTSINIVERLNALKLSPSAFVDEGTVIDATQARINAGAAGLASVVVERLPDAVAHLKGHMSVNMSLANEVKHFADSFATTIASTPPTAPALRAALGSPDGRAYLLCEAALKG